MFIQTLGCFTIIMSKEGALKLPVDPVLDRQTISWRHLCKSNKPSNNLTKRVKASHDEDIDEDFEDDTEEPRENGSPMRQQRRERSGEQGTRAFNGLSECPSLQKCKEVYSIIFHLRIEVDEATSIASSARVTLKKRLF